MPTRRLSVSISVSYGKWSHTQLVEVHSPKDMRILGETIDDAVGEAFDKAAKIIGLPSRWSAYRPLGEEGNLNSWNRSSTGRLQLSFQA